MLIRHVFGYLPAQIAAGGGAVLLLAGLTRLLPPEAYGLYALGTAIALFGQTYLFHWLDLAIARLYPEALARGEGAAFARAALRGFRDALLAAGLLFGLGLALYDGPAAEWRVAAAALPLLVVRAVVMARLNAHRAALQVGRYVRLEVGQTLAGLAGAFAAVWLWGDSAVAVLLGLAAGAGLAALAELATAARPGVEGPGVGGPGAGGPGRDAAATAALLRFGLPLTAGFALEFLLTTGNRFVIQALLGPAALGHWAAAAAVVERSTGLLLGGVAAAAFPLAVRALERDGPAAARAQMGQNGGLLLAVALPAAAGLALTAEHLAAVLVGPAFRAPVAALLPWLAAAALPFGLMAHYFDHAFHLARRPAAFILTLGPAAALNLALCALLVPRFGLIGAAWANLAAVAAALALSILLGRRAFALPWPLASAAKAGLATLAMAGALRLLDLPADAAGLCGMVAAGAAAYAAAALALDLCGCRTALRRRIPREATA
ncbi:MAG TPA: polysaccharide biosynthesis C-terminal domain-containing protein [Alphaproteobacteria bacterium]|nr:polysaccharide biosynthesis C-terminal domain-containing protein [Alphaproteobacteria bacterium]